MNHLVPVPEECNPMDSLIESRSDLEKFLFRLPADLSDFVASFRPGHAWSWNKHSLNVGRFMYQA